MLALRWDAVDRVEGLEIEPPGLSGPRDVKVAVKNATVCTTDIHIVRGQFGVDTPRVLGHEVAGEVVQAGAEVDRVRVGDHVALQPTLYCKQCPACREGHIHLCPNRKFVGLNHDGGFAEQMVAPQENWIPVPASVSLRQAALVEPLGCVLHALDVLKPRAGNGIVITGAGASAYLFVAVLLDLGISAGDILVSGRRDKKLSVMGDLGVRVVDVRTEDLVAVVARQFGERGPDILIDQTGDEDLVNGSLDWLARKGVLFIYDYMGKPMPFDFGKMQLAETTILTSTGCPDTMDRAIALIDRKGVDVTPILTHDFDKKDMEEAFRTTQDKLETHVKSIINF